MIKKLLALVLALFAAAAFAATEVNTATQAELDSVKGIGPAISGKIVAERSKGAFKDWPDLVTRVKGVGDKNSVKLSAAGLTVNGAALSGAPATPTAAKLSSSKATTASTPPATNTAPTPAPSAAPAATPSTAMSAADKKAAAKQERDDREAAKKAAKAASAAAAASASTKK